MKNQLAFQYSQRNKKLREQGFKDYQEYLLSDTWRTIKLKIKERQSKGQKFWNQCASCGKTGIQLIPHHMRYKLRQTSLGSIVPVCQNCHEKIHTYHKNHPRQSLKQATRKFVKKPKKNEEY